MSCMFCICCSLESLDLSSFDTSNVTSLAGMFYNCYNLENIDVSGFETNKVKDMAWMFGIGNTQYNNGARSKLQSLDVSNFNTSNVTNMEGMFQYLKLIPELDVSGFDTSKDTNMEWMFYGCYNLRSIYASENFVTNNVTLSTNMFYGDSNLKGGNGTLYNGSHSNKEYARIDKEETPGYFTLKDNCQIVCVDTNK